MTPKTPDAGSPPAKPLHDIDDVPLVRVRWPRWYRLVPSQFPPVRLFEDLGDPKDWEALAAIESLTNPRLDASLGDLAKLAPEHRASGPGASFLVAPFFHASEDRPGRFHHAGQGALYVARTFETALAEVAWHQGQFLAATAEPPGWTGHFRTLCGKLDGELRDVRGSVGKALGLQGEDLELPQTFADALRAKGERGVVYSSVRHEGGECAALLRVDGMRGPTQTDHLRYHWNGERVDIVERCPGMDASVILRL